MPLIYSAHWVLPIVGPLIEQGAVAIDGATIVAVGPQSEIFAKFPGATVADFGEAAITPGLINTHSHLELTVMRGFLEAEEDDFFAWLRKLTMARLAMTDDDLIVSAKCGAIEAARAGITCLGDSSSFGLQSMRALGEIGLRGIVYQESFGPDPALAEEKVGLLREQLGQMVTQQMTLVSAGVSPHAPYTVSARQLEMIARLAIDEHLPLMIHAAESEAEQRFMVEGQGTFADGLKKRGIEWRAPGISTVHYLKQHDILHTKPLLAHCVNVDDADLESIKASGAGVAHCPKSNAKLGHGRAPFKKFVARGINAGLGSDSVASNNTCDILEEARFATLLARVDLGEPESPTDIRAADALFAATLGGARAMNLADKIGALQEGMQADLAVIDLAGIHERPLRNPADTLIFSASGRDVLRTIVAGREIYRDGQVVTADEQEIIHKAQQTRTKLDRLT